MSRPTTSCARCEMGKCTVIVEPGNPPTYRFDPMRDESRLARLVVDDVLKGAAGSTGAVAREGGSDRRFPVRGTSTG